MKSNQLFKQHKHIKQSSPEILKYLGKQFRHRDRGTQYGRFKIGS